MLPTAPVKPNGDLQRADVGLTLAIANTLGQMVLDGITLHPGVGKLKLVAEGKNVELSRRQVNNWMTRQTVIPETGQTLRSFLDEKYEEKRVKRDQAEQNTIRETAQSALAEIVALPNHNEMTETRLRPLEGEPATQTIDGIVYEIRGKTIESGVNPKIVEAKTKALTFALERLNPERYSPRLETRNTHLVFSLADLARAKERRDEMATTVTRT